MIKKNISLFLIILCSTYLYASQVGSKIDLNVFYHPSITLDDNTDLPVYSSMASTYDFSPVYLKINNHQISPYLSIFHVSRSIIYQNLVLREFCAFGVGLDYGYIFNSKFLFHSKFSMGIGSLGESLNSEMYMNLALIPSYILKSGDNYNISLDFSINFVYRKYLLSPCVGVGISTSFDWITDYINKNKAIY
ncbi:MAG: hypothetical protein EOL97_03070 [Spirochaetia bacterium]|nr:hypothetical protein [Spirochaetia bacterium]